MPAAWNTTVVATTAEPRLKAPIAAFNVRESKQSLDLFSHARFQLLDAVLFPRELGYHIKIVSVIPDSLSSIPDSKTQDPEF